MQNKKYLILIVLFSVLIISATACTQQISRWTQTCTKRGLPYNPCGYYDINGKCKGICIENVDEEYCTKNLLGHWNGSKCTNVPEMQRALG